MKEFIVFILLFGLFILFGLAGMIIKSPDSGWEVKKRKKKSKNHYK